MILCPICRRPCAPGSGYCGSDCKREGIQRAHLGRDPEKYSNPPYTPTPEEIEAACAAIRDTWTTGERLRR